MPNRSKDKNQIKSDPLVLQLEVGRRVNDPTPQKETHVTEAGYINDTTQNEGVAAEALMTLLSQSLQEALIAPKKQITIGFLNVRTLAGATRTAEVAKR